MKRSDFSEGFPGRLTALGAGVAYTPAPLPPTIEWTPALVGSLSAADRALGQLAGVGRYLANPHLLIGPFKRREAVLSSRIEGTQSTLSDLLLFEMSPGTTDEGDALEVSNYVRALEQALTRLKTLPISLRMLREIHATLMDGAHGERKDPGAFRRVQNFIGRPGCTLDEATFVPPPVDEMLRALHDLERFMHAASAIPPLVRIALMHYQFEAIHPFLDGNGRVGRLLITLQLCAEGLLPGPLLYLSAYFERTRPAYYAGLRNVSLHGHWVEWIDYFLRGVAEQSLDAVQRADRLTRLRETFRKRIQGPRVSAHALTLVDALFASPSVSIAKVAKITGVTHRAAGLLVARLVDAGVLTEVTGRQRDRVFVAREIVRAVE